MRIISRVQIAVALLVFAGMAFGQGVPLDISSGFNMDCWAGPLEMHALWNYDPPYGSAPLRYLQGEWPEGVGWFVFGQNLLMIGNTSETGFGIPYSIEGQWFHLPEFGGPQYKTGTQGTPENGVVVGAEVTYHIASTLGNPTLPGDWLEVADPGANWDAKPNTMVVCSSHNIAEYQIVEIVAELPEYQKAQYAAINFILAPMNRDGRARGMRIHALYDDGSEELLWAFDDVSDTSPVMTELDDSHPDFNLVYSFEEAYNNAGGAGSVRDDDPGGFYEFASLLPLDSDKVLWGIRVYDVQPHLNWSARGLAVFAATATLPPSPELTISEAQFDTVNNLMYFDLVFLNSDGRTDMIGGFGASATLSGADAGHFTAAPDEVRNKLGTEMDATVDPAPYAWTTFLFPVVANSTASQQMSFGQNAWFPTEHVALDSLAEGTVVARFYYEWDGVEVSEVCVTIESYAQIDPGPVFTTSGGDSILGTVLNDGQNILVPAAGDPAITVAAQDDLDWIYQNTANSMSNGGHMISLTVSVTDLSGNNDVSVTVEKLPGSGAGEVTLLNDPGGDPLVKYISGGMRSDGLVGTGTLTLRVTATGDVAGQATVDLPFTVRPLGDVDGNGAPEPGDVTVLIMDLNGAPPPGYNARAFDLDANGASEPGDVQILINILNGQPVP